MSESQSNNGIEDVVGGLVWVRRRNGSWWPGRIMGLHELPKSCVVSPRSGTPVKLLGREDASVDWYNLEKSKRVKAFRCGEYDECIAKAKASAASCNRKAVKYARRENAILHALELEGSLDDDDDQQTSQFRMDSPSDTKDDYVIEKKSMPNSNPVKDAIPTKELSQSGISFEDPDHVSTSQIHSLQKKRRKTPNDSEDDGNEGTKRMRGLEDLGLGVLSKQKSGVRLNFEGAQELVQLDSALHNERSISNSLSNGSAITRSKGPGASFRKGQSQVASIHENMKRKNRRRPLTKVLESTAMVSVPVLCEQGAGVSHSSLRGATDCKVSGLDSTDSKKTTISPAVNNNIQCNGASCDKEALLDTSEHSCDAGHTSDDVKPSQFSTLSGSPENDGSDGLFDVPFVGEAKGTQGFSPVIPSGATQKQSGEVLDESGSTSFQVDLDNARQRIAKRPSRWQLKGKRNSRNQSQKTSHSLNWRNSLDKSALPDVSLTSKGRTDGFSEGLNCKVEINIPGESLASDNRVHWSNRTSEPTYVDSSQYGKRSSLKREDVPLTKDLYLNDGVVSPTVPQRSLPYRQSRFTPHPKYQDMDVPDRNTFSGPLYDVNLEVRASYRGQHVPLVSLMSKLNGKAIVGHPVTVEVWEDGYCDMLLRRINGCPTSSSGELYARGNTSDQSMDAPRRSMLLDRYGRYADGRQEGYAGIMRPHSADHLRLRSSPSPKKSPKARKSILLNKKTRRLSSFTVAPMRNEDGDKPVVQKPGGPVVACVPVKVVFSRLHEALNGSMRPTSDHRSNNP